jgi:hypothetical protein
VFLVEKYATDTRDASDRCWVRRLSPHPRCGAKASEVEASDAVVPFVTDAELATVPASDGLEVFGLCTIGRRGRV